MSLVKVKRIITGSSNSPMENVHCAVCIWALGTDQLLPPVRSPAGSPSKGEVNLQEELCALNMAMDESLTGDAFCFSLMKINLIMRA